MQRLTQKDDQGNWSLKGVTWESLYEGQVITKELRERLYGALWKLMEYEDAGLSPEKVEQLKESRRWIPVEEMNTLNEILDELKEKIIDELKEEGILIADERGYRGVEIINTVTASEKRENRIERRGKEMTEKQRNMIEGMNLLLQKLNKYGDSTLLEVQEIIRISNEVHKEILEENT